MVTTILLVDDDPLMRRSLTYSLEQSGYQVQTAATASEALQGVRQRLPDLVLLDIGLPDMDGLELLRHLQGICQIPVIFLTARRRELDEVLGLELGAEDYITKPFDMDVLLARIKKVLRRAQQPAALPTPSILIAGDLEINTAAHTVTVGGKAVELPQRTFNLLRVLAERSGRVVSIEELLERVWGSEFAGEPQVVYVHIRWLREKLEENPNKPKRVITVRGAGYKLVPQEG